MTTFGSWRVPERMQMMERGFEADRFGHRRRVVDPQPEALDDVVETHRLGTRPEERFHVCVGDMIVPGKEHVARVASDVDARHARIEGEAGRGVCDLITRRRVCDSRSDTTSSRLRVSMSSHGEITLIGSPSGPR